MPPTPRLSRPSPARPSPPPAARIMVAGVDKDVRAAVEALIRRSLGARAASGSWSISAVSLGGKWSVTVDGPGDRLRGVSFVTDPSRLADAIRKVVEGDSPAAAAPAPAKPGPAAPTSSEARDQHVCQHCAKPVLVVYEREPDEPREIAPLACPHCWKVGHVEVGVRAAADGDYRAEKG